MEMPIIVLFVIVAIALAAPRYGVDSRRLRPGEGPAQRGPTPWSDVQRMVAYVLRSAERASTRPTAPGRRTPSALRR